MAQSQELAAAPALVAPALFAPAPVAAAAAVAVAVAVVEVVVAGAYLDSGHLMFAMQLDQRRASALRAHKQHLHCLIAGGSWMLALVMAAAAVELQLLAAQLDL